MLTIKISSGDQSGIDYYYGTALAAGQPGGGMYPSE
jgi:hypothetical protein